MSVIDFFVAVVLGIYAGISALIVSPIRWGASLIMLMLVSATALYSGTPWAQSAEIPVKFAWDPNPASDNVIEYRLETRLNAGTWTAHPAVAGDKTEVQSEFSLAPGDTLTARVAACNGYGCSGPSAETSLSVGGRLPDFLLADAQPLLAFEAESFHLRALTAQSDWVTKSTPAGASGVSLCATGTEAMRPGVAATLGYRITTPAAATYQLWYRGFAPSAKEDSIRLSLNGTLVSPDLYIRAGAWIWKGPQPLTLIAGTNALQIGARDGGMCVDKLVLARDPGYVPQGLGPPSEKPATPKWRRVTVEVPAP